MTRENAPHPTVPWRPLTVAFGLAAGAAEACLAVASWFMQQANQVMARIDRAREALAEATDGFFRDENPLRGGMRS
jgi:hypothetical protein